MNLRWTAKPFEELGIRELHDVMRLRVDVFVVEQQCIYPELDGQDPLAYHILGYDPAGALVAYARILPPLADGMPHLGRFVVHRDHRSKGLGHMLIDIALNEAQRWTGINASALAAQTHLEQLYAQHGFERIGADYDWDGIPHLNMVRNANK